MSTTDDARYIPVLDVTTHKMFVTLGVLVANPKNYFTRWPIPLYRIQYNTVQYNNSNNIDNIVI